jgi:hypothetical protein
MKIDSVFSISHGGIKIFIIILFIMILPSTAEAQCSNKISLTRVETTEVDQQRGSIEVNVVTEGSYKSQLYQIKGSGKILAQEKSGMGNSKIIFTSLPADDNYQVLVIFESEEQKSCAKRQISEISTLKNQI